MSSSTFVLIAAWIWLAAGVGMLVGMAYLLREEEIDEALAFLIFAAAAAASIASVTLGLHLIGFATVALWTWRVLSIAYVLVAVVLAIRVDGKAVDRAAAVVNVAVAGVITSASFVMRSGLVVPLPSTPPAPATVITIQGVSLWHGIALGLLALFTVVFLFLFIRTLERGGTPQFESHWGGIGGGLSGWRVSTSLTYLAGAFVFGLLFAVFVFQLDLSRRDEPPASSATPSQTRTQTQPASGSTPPAATPDTNAGASGTTGTSPPAAGGQPTGAAAPAATPPTSPVK